MGAGPALSGLRPLSVSQGGHPALLWAVCPGTPAEGHPGGALVLGVGLQSQPLPSSWEAMLLLETLRVGAGLAALPRSCSPWELAHS